VEEFRRLKNTDGDLLTHNNRPVQPIGDRVVWFNEKENYEDSGAADITPFVFPIILTLGIILLAH
jgi:hypothetical protein